MRNWFCAMGLALSVGCATAVVRPYVGEQQAWPTASGSIVMARYAVPIFTSLPPAPYDVLGELRINSPFYAQPEEGHIKILADKAREMGADAIVFVDGQIYFSANYGPKSGDAATAGGQASLTQVNRFNPESFKPGVTILAIKWTSEPPAGLPRRMSRAVNHSAMAATPRPTSPPIPASEFRANPAPPPPPPAPVPPAPAPPKVEAPSAPKAEQPPAPPAPPHRSR